MKKLFYKINLSKKNVIFSNNIMLKILFISLFIILNYPDFIFSQQFLDSKEVKIKAPLKEIWEYKTNKATINFHQYNSIFYTNTVEGIRAISLNDGKELWKHNFLTDGSIPSVVAFSNKFAVYVSYKDQKSSLILIDLSNGVQKWSIDTKATIFKPTALLNDDFVYAIDGALTDWDDRAKFNEMDLISSTVKAYKIEDGKQVWELNMKDSKTDLMNVVSNYLFLSFDLDEKKNFIMCVDSKKGAIKWEYKPGSIFNRFLTGEITFFNNALYTYPKYGGNGAISRIDVTTGEERWIVYKIERQRNFFITNNKLYNISEDLQSFNPKNGDELISKSVLPSNFWSELFSGMGQSIFLARVVSVMANWSYYFPGSNDSLLKFMPNIHMLKGLQNQDVITDKGLFSIIKDDDEVYYKYCTLKDDDDEDIELKFTQEEKDLCLANGSSESTIFASSKGKIYSINFKQNSIEWKKDFSKEDKELTIGLLFSNDKLLLITNKRILALVSE